jgi:hypothetical protein
MNRSSRRCFLKTSAAATIMGSTAVCAEQDNPSPVVSSFRVNLICSGMLAFYWDLDKNSLRILIPQPYHGKQLIHLVRFGGVGGNSLKAGSYRLELPGAKPPNGDPYNLTPDKNVLFGRDNPKQSLTVAKSGTFAQIEIPRPNTVQTARIISKKDASPNPFFGGDATLLKINPKTIPAFYILTYNGISGGPRLVRSDGKSAAVFAPQPIVLNIHLYSERPFNSAPADHIELFNAMFTRVDTAKPLSMTHNDTVNAQGQLADLSGEKLGDDFSRLDLETLAELKISSGVAPSTEAKVIADPAGCSNGWVFFRS